ncbi:M66 family metalloprotease [Actinoplanes sp. NPDC026619]|uniref:M66 family metalloprotease n=1 Tax=Actinoplanes sp. NPDC026619 TaxID=3155798 RepID=UPI0033EFAA42
MIARTAAAGAAALLAGLTAAAPAHAEPVAHVPATYTVLADATAQPVLVMGGQTVPVGAAVSRGLTPGQQVTATVRGATGTATAVADAVQDGSAAVTAATATAAAMPSSLTGAHSVTIVPVSAAVSDGTTVTALRQEARQLGDFWSAQSSGALTVPDTSISVHDWVTAPINTGKCDIDAWKNAALTALGRTEDSFDGRDHLVVYMAKGASTCSWTGLAYTPGNIIWVNGYTYADALEHEFGHNLGLNHSGDQTCTYALTGATCEDVEYGDYDVMGYARYGDGNGLNAAKADELGLLDSVTPATGVRVTLAPRLTRSGVRAVKVTGGGNTYYVEYRPATTGAGEAGDPSPGVQVRQSDDSTGLSTLLAVLHYTDDTDLGPASLPAGHAMALPGTGYDVLTDSISATGAVVHLRAASTDTVTAPTLTSATTWTAPAIDAAAIGGYLLIVDNQRYVVAPGRTSWPLTLTAGSHTATIATIGTQGGVSATRSRTFTAGSTTAGGPQVTFPAQPGTTTMLRWQAVTGASKYTVTVDGATKTVTATKLALTLSRGTHTVAVRSYDATGTASNPTTGTITVTRTWTATAGKITAPANNAKVASAATLKWTAPAAKSGDPAVTGYDIRLDSGAWVTVSAATRSRAVKLRTGKHTLTVRTRYETGATAQTTVKVTR